MLQGKYSQIQGEFVPAINGAIKLKKLACAFPELCCTFGNRSIVPDIAVFVWARIPRDETGEVANTFALAPDWMIEILSPNQSQTRVTKNILHCLQHDTQMGWLIDPEEKTVLVDRPKQEIEVCDRPAQLLLPDFASALTLTVQDLFGWLFL